MFSNFLFALSSSKRIFAFAFASRLSRARKLPVKSTMSQFWNAGGSWTLRRLLGVMAVLISGAVMENIVEARTENRPPPLFCRRHVLPLGYSCVEHRVETEDGYTLVMHRISHRNPFDGRPSPTTQAIPNLQILSPASVSESIEMTTLNPQETIEPAAAPETFRPRIGRIIGPAFSRAVDASERNAVASPSTSMVGPVVGPSQAISAAMTASEFSPTSMPRSPTETLASPSSSQDSATCGHQCPGAPVLLMHPEFFNGDIWFWQTDSPRDHLLPLMLVDAGYDVWVGHHRATLWGHDHVELQSDDSRYWDWSWDEQAQFDIPALLSLIKVKTRQKIHYIGVSQSATVGASAATTGEVAQLLKSITLVGPTIYRGNTNSLVLNAWAFLFGHHLDERYYREGYQHGTFNYLEFPLDTIYGQGPMSVALDTISGPNCCLGHTAVKFDNGWDGTTSFKNLIHFQQGVRTNTWQHFDYESARGNMKAYGTIRPPSYNPGAIPKDLAVYVVFGDKDMIVPRSGVLRFLTRLNDPRSLSLPYYAHFDLVYGTSRTEAVYYPILKFLDSIH